MHNVCFVFAQLEQMIRTALHVLVPAAIIVRERRRRILSRAVAAYTRRKRAPLDRSSARAARPVITA